VKRKLIALAAGAAAMAALGAGPATGQSIAAYRHIILDGHKVKWGDPQTGTGAIVTYATVATATAFPGVRNCRAMAPLGPLLTANAVPSNDFDAELTAAFALWSAVADIRFVPARSAEAADILIGAQVTPRGRAFTNVEYEEAGPAGGPRRLTRSLICLNPAERWKTGFDGDLGVYDLRYTLLHEIGHAIGLDHPAVARQLMDFRYLEEFRAPQEGDIKGAVALYGPSRNPTASLEEARRLADAKPPRNTGG
jgi:hypothetical protein